MVAQSHRTVLSRRDLVKGTAVGAAAAGASLLGANPLTAPSRHARAQEPQSGGVYRLMGSGDMRSLDPAGAEGSEDWWSAGELLFNRLYAYDRNTQFYPDLAADMPTVSTDGLVYTIPLRQGVKFHNGRELVADDVAFSLAWQLWPEVYSWGKTYMENVVGYDDVIAGTKKDLAGVKVVDPYTVEITLKKPQAVFPLILTMTMNGISPHQETLDAGADWGKTVVIGTGPFKFVEWKQGQQVIFERHPEYYKSGLPYLDRVELSLNVDPSVQMLRWENKEAEFVHTVPDSELANVLSDDKYQAVRRQTPSLGSLRIAMYTRAKPFDDLRVRQAVAMAIDKQFFSRSTAGTWVPLEGIYLPQMLQFEESFKSNYQYDPDKAKALLTEAGYGGGIQGIKLIGGVDEKTQLEGFQADLKAIGIEVEVISARFQEYLERIHSGEIQLTLNGWSASFPDAYDYVSGWLTCASINDAGYNFGDYCNQRIDDLVGQAEGLPQTDPQRIADYREIEDLVINQDAAIVGLGYHNLVALSQDYMQNDPIDGLMGGWPFLETASMTKH
jgi:ABC-type transport system substrate-binding protein